jgi:hypothetical protein
MEVGNNEGRAIPLAREHSRRNFLKTAGAVTAAISAMGIGGFATRAGAQDGGEQPYMTYEGVGDAGILQLAYLLEQLEGTFYAAGVDSGLFEGEALAQIAAIRDHEFAHAEAIAATLGQLGAEVPAVPEFTFPDEVFEDPNAFLELAATFEPVGIGAYQGAAPALESKEILAAALSIHNAECQHRCAINILQGVVPPNNVAFEEALPLPEVQAAVEPFGITG